MSACIGAVDFWRQAVQQIRHFDWWQLRHPQNAGRWPLAPRLLVYSLCVLCLFSLSWTLSILLAPALSSEEKSAALNLQQKVMVQQKQNLVDAARTLELDRQKMLLSALLLNHASEVSDVTKTMEWIRSAATVSNVQLMSVTPEFFTDRNQIAMVINARLMLTSLPDFWTSLMNRPAAFVITDIQLEPVGKPRLYNMRLGLLTDAASHILPTTGLPDSAVTAEAAATSASPDKTDSKGFLVRAGRPQFLYLIRDEQGRLTGVTK